jgi:peptidase M28-like protein
MGDVRIYRGALLPAVLVLVVMMFSIESRPEARRATLAPDGFDGAQAKALHDAVLARAPRREPGSEGDNAVADFVVDQFQAIEGGQVFEQRFGGRFAGRDVELRNVVLVLPGESDRRVVLVAHRDTAAGTGSASSAASTAALLEIAANFGGSRHRKTLVFASTDGSGAGAVGARNLVGQIGPERVDGAIVLSQLGAREIRKPLVLPWSAGPLTDFLGAFRSRQSTSAQLVRSTDAAVRDETGRSGGDEGPLGHLFRLALPSGLGEQAALISEELDAVGLSAAGERPLLADEDDELAFSDKTLEEFGRAALSLTLALDVATRPLTHGPDAYVPLAGNLIPGWSLALLALALLIPAWLMAIEGSARGLRRGEPMLRHVAWLLGRSVPFVAVLLLAYFLALVGLIPQPEVPFDPGGYPLETGGIVALALLAAVFVGVSWLTHPLRPPRRDPVLALPFALGALLCLTVTLLWLFNPYLALLLVPAGYVWLVAALPGTRTNGLIAAAAVLGALLPVAGAVAYVADRLDVGLEVPWQLGLMASGGQLGVPAALLFCLLGGLLVAVVTAARATRAAVEPGPPSPPEPVIYTEPEPEEEPESALRPGYPVPRS